MGKRRPRARLTEAAKELPRLRRQYRDEQHPKGLSQESLAEKLKVTQATVSRWESGAEKPLSHLRDALERLLGLSRGLWDTAKQRAMVAHLGTGAAAE